MATQISNELMERLLVATGDRETREQPHDAWWTETRRLLREAMVAV